MFKNKKNIVILTVISLIATYILNVIDYLQTVYAIQIFGISAEANPVGRFMFESNCILWVKLLGILVVLSVIGFIIIMFEARYIWVSFMLFVVYLVVVLHNFIQLQQANILNFKLDESTIATMVIACVIVVVVLTVTIGALCTYCKYFNKK